MYKCTNFITLTLKVPEKQSLTRKLNINLLSQWSAKYWLWFNYFGCIQLSYTRCIDVPCFITQALIVLEKQSWTRKLDINLLSQWSVKYRSRPYFYECLQLPSTRIINVPSFITLALIGPEKQELNRKLDINLLSQWSLKYRSWHNFYECIHIASIRCIDVPNFITLSLIVPEKQSWTRKLDKSLRRQRRRRRRRRRKSKTYVSLLLHRRDNKEKIRFNGTSLAKSTQPFSVLSAFWIGVKSLSSILLEICSNSVTDGWMDDGYVTFRKQNRRLCDWGHLILTDKSHFTLNSFAWTDGQTDKAATICSPFGEHKNIEIIVQFKEVDLLNSHK